jgi:hypothetical protein
MSPHAETDRYVASKNMLKELIMQKRVHWDYDYIRAQITARIRLLGYGGSITISFPSFNDKVKIRPGTNISKCCHSSITTFFCWITCLCILWYPIKWAYADKECIVHCDYQMMISPQNWMQSHIHLIHR